MKDTPSTFILGEVDLQTKRNLTELFLYVYTTHSYYLELFNSLGVSKNDISLEDPISLLQRIPIMNGRSFNSLSKEVLRAEKNIIDIETTSGTTGPRKKRFISTHDDESELETLIELLKGCGVTTADSVACIDTDPLTLMTSFTRALDSMNVKESYMFCAGSNTESSVEKLSGIEPTMIITIPSIIERFLPFLRMARRNNKFSKLSKIVYAGESLSEKSRHILESEIKVEVFGYYGTTETSALGIECTAHSGIHLYSERNIAELRSNDRSIHTGEIMITTLFHKTMPLLRYRIKDVVQYLPEACECGDTSPRVKIIGRADNSFSLLGAKFYYASILGSVYTDTSEQRFMQIILSRQIQDLITLVLPEHFRLSEPQILKTLLKLQPDLDFLVNSQYIRIAFKYVNTNYFTATRKTRSIVDKRDSDESYKPFN